MNKKTRQRFMELYDSLSLIQIIAGNGLMMRANPDTVKFSLDEIIKYTTKAINIQRDIHNNLE